MKMISVKSFDFEYKSVLYLDFLVFLSSNKINFTNNVFKNWMENYENFKLEYK